MRYEYRVTKYDPRFRDARGRYTRKEWTSFGDVGRRFNGRRLTMHDYLVVESGYLAVLAALLEEAEVTRLRLVGLERAKKKSQWREGAVLAASQAVEFARLALRGEVWGVLIEPRKAFVHFGWDYYLFVGLSRATPGAMEVAARHGIFVEPCRSPISNTARSVLRRAAKLS